MTNDSAKSTIDAIEDLNSPLFENSNEIPAGEIEDELHLISWNRWLARRAATDPGPDRVRFESSGGWDFPRDMSLSSDEVALIEENYERERVERPVIESTHRTFAAALKAFVEMQQRSVETKTLDPDASEGK